MEPIAVNMKEAEKWKNQGLNYLIRVRRSKK